MAAKLEDLFERILELRAWQDSGAAEREALGAVATSDDEESRAAALRKAASKTPEAAWKAAFEESVQSGQLLRRGLRYAVAIVSLVGALVGFLSVAALTAGDGRTPINLVWLIALTMVLPLLTVSLSFIFSLMLNRGKGGGLWADLLASFVRRGVRLAGRSLDHGDPKSVLRLNAALGVVRGDYKLLEPVLPWTLLRLSQRFALSLSLGFIGALLVRLAGLDLSFGWYTTVDAISNNMSAMVSFLSGPFGWLSADLAPSEALVQATRYSRFNSSFAGGPSAAQMSGQWWPFLMAGAVFWGILPRGLMLLWASWQEQRAVANVLEETEALWQLEQRLHPERAAVKGSAKRGGHRGKKQTSKQTRQQLERDAQPTCFVRSDEEQGGDAAEALALEASRHDELKSADTIAHRPDQKLLRAAYLYWEQDNPVPESVRKDLETRLTMQPALQKLWGNDADADARMLEEIATLKPEVVMVFAEPFANPGKGFARQYGALREALGPKTPVIVSVAWYDEDGAIRPSEPRQLEVWQQSLRVFGDAALRYLDVDASSRA